MKTGNALLLSIRPRFVKQIFEGTKIVELRRVRPRIEVGDLVVVYASGSEKSLVGAFQVAGVVKSTPGSIWRRYGAGTGLKKTEFDCYYFGVETAYAIEISHTWRLQKPVKLADLRRQPGGFHPPQSYRYLKLGEVLNLGGNALAGMSDQDTSVSREVQLRL